MTTYTVRCKKCNYSYKPKSNIVPNICPNCSKTGTLLKEEEHLAEIIEINDDNDFIL